MVRSARTSLSNWAMAASMFCMSLPVESSLMGSVTERSVTLNCFKKAPTMA